MSALFPTAYFGSIAYFQQLLQFDVVQLEVCDTFPKQTFRNRCVILGQQGEQRLTLPVDRIHGSKTSTLEMCISDHQDWRNNHWRSIQSAYASSPYFEHYASDIHALVFWKESNLVAYNTLITQKIAALFDCRIEFTHTSDYKQIVEDVLDLRNLSFESEKPVNFISLPYTQVLFEHVGFRANPCILDLLFCEGPMGRKKLFIK